MAPTSSSLDAAAVHELAALEAAEPTAPTSSFRNRWYRSKTLVVGLVIVGVFVVLAVGAPVFTSYSPSQQNLTAMLQGPSAAHWLGTDDLGRDVWSRLLYGGRIDLSIGVLAVLAPFVIGTALGSLAGYYGRWVDSTVMRGVDIVVAFPFYVLIIAIVFVLGSGVRNIFIAITIVGWVSYARIIRGEILVAKRREYVLAAQAAGLSDTRIIVRHLLPNVMGQAIVYAMSDIVITILAVVTLSYLGLGIQPPTADWGTMISSGQQYMTTNWQLSTIPGLCIVLVGLGLSLIGDGLSDLLKPE